MASTRSGQRWRTGCAEAEHLRELRRHCPLLRAALLWFWVYWRDNARSTASRPRGSRQPPQSRHGSQCVAGVPCVLRHAYRRNAIPAIPTDVVDAPAAHSTPMVQRALTGSQMALLATQVGERHPVYGLIVLFMAYSGLRSGGSRA